MKKALIVGAAGFVGGYLIDCLANQFKMEVFGTKLAEQNLSNSKCIFYDLNLLEKDEILNLLKNLRPDYIFHLAAQSSVAVSWKNPQLTVDINIKGAINLFDSIRELDYKPRILVIGSGEEYGPVSADNARVGEETILHPGNIYAATKACQNMIGSIYAKAYKMDLILVRAFNHIGPGQAPIFVVSDFCKQVAEIEKGLKEPVMYVGNLSAKRDFTDVRDVVRSYAMLIEKGVAGETYNIGSGNAVAIQDILNAILSHSRTKIEVTVDPAKLRPVDVPKIEADTSKVFNVTGWKPEISLEETIINVLDYWRNNI